MPIMLIFTCTKICSSANLAQRHLSEPRRWCNGISNVNPKWDLNFPKLFVSGWETKLRNYYIYTIIHIYIYIHTHNRKSFTTRKTINSCTVYTKLIDFSLLDPALLDRCCSRDPRSFTDPDFPVVKLTALTQDFDIPTSSDIQTVTLSNRIQCEVLRMICGWGPLRFCQIFLLPLGHDQICRPGWKNNVVWGFPENFVEGYEGLIDVCECPRF